MMIIKRIVATASLAMGVVALATVLAWLLVDDATLVSALGRQLETVSNTQIRYQGDARVTRTLTPTLSIDQLVVEDRSARYRLESRSFQVQLSLPRLLLGQLDLPLLHLGDTRITLMQGASSAHDTGKTTGQGFSRLRFKPVLHDVQIGRISVIRGGSEVRLPEVDVDKITFLLEPESDTLTLTAQVDLAGEICTIDAALPDLSNAFSRQQLGFSASAQIAGFTLEADGHVDLNETSPRVDAAIRASASEPSRVSIGNDDLIIPGTLTANARLAGNFERLALDKISARWKGAGESELELNGDIDNLVQLDGMQLRLAGKLDKPTWLAPLLPDRMGPLKSAELQAGISGAYKQLGIRDLSLQATTEDELDLLLSGQFDVVPATAAMQPENIDLKLTYSAPTTHAARILLFDRVPELGAITGKLDIVAAADVPALKNIMVKTKDSEGIEAEMSGSIARLPLDPDQPNTGYDLDVVMKASRTSVMAKRLGVDLPFNEPMSLSYRIEGDTRALAVKQISLSAGSKKAVQIGVQGQLLFGDWELADPLQTVDLKLRANSPDTASLSQLIGQPLPELGALDATARLHRVSGKQRLDDLKIHTRSGAPVKLTLNGSVDDVILFPQASLHGIKLKAAATATDSAQLNRLFDLKQQIPPIGPFKASAKITGSHQQLLIKEVSVSAGQAEILLVTAKGRLGKLSGASDWYPRKADLSINAKSSSSSAFVKSLGYHMPELGPLKAQAVIQDKDNTLGIASAQIRVGDDAYSPAVKATGFIDDLFGTAKTRWDVKLNIDGRSLAAFAEQQKIPDLGPLVGSIVIGNSDGSLGVDALEIKTTQTELLSLAVSGRFGDFQKFETLSLDANLNARDLQLIGALFDRQWPAIGPVQMQSKIKQKGNSTGLDTTLSAGDIRFNAAISGVFESTPPHISGKITAQGFFIPGLFEEAVDSAEQEQPVNPRVFSQTPIDFTWLGKADLDLSVAIASFNNEKSRLESAQLMIKQKAGNLSIHPATLVYPQGKLDLNLQIATQDPPRVSFKAYGTDLNPWQTLDIQQGRQEFDTDLDVDIAVTTAGTSLHELAANADGEVYITMKNGKIRRTLLDLMLLDVVGWTISKTIRDPFVNIDCGVADYAINKGVVTTNAFLLDNKSIAISGEGSIDLGLEQLDYVILPKKKSRIITKADPVKISGALSAPTVTSIPWKSAATTYGSLVFGPYIFVGLTAADRIKGALGIGSKSSPCLEYERWHKSRSEAPEKKTE